MLKRESYKRGIVLSTVWNLVVKAVLVLNTIIIAYYFGTSVDTDLYFYIFSTVTLLAGLVNGMDLAVILPEGMHLKVDKDFSQAVSFYNFFGLCYLLAGIGLFLVLFFFAVPIYSSISSFRVSDLEQHRSMLLFSSILPLLMILSNYITAVLTTLKYFTAPLIANGVVYVSALVSLVIFHDQFGVNALFAGMVAGYVLNILMLLLFMFFRLNWHAGFSSIHVTRRVKKNLASVQLGNLATFSFNYGIIVMLSSLPAGIYSAYNYSMQALNIPNNFIVSQVAAVVGIKFNELAAKNLRAEMNKIFLQSIDILLFLIVPFCILTYVYAEPIVKLLYVRGGFTSDSAEKVTYFLRYLIFLSPCLAINTFISRMMTAGKKVSQAFFFQIGFNITILLLLILGTVFWKVPGFIGAMLATYYFYILFICIYVFKWLMPFVNYKQVIRSMLLIFLYNLPFLWIIDHFYGQVQELYWLAIITLVYYSVILLVNHYIKISQSTESYISHAIKTVRLKMNI